MAKALLGYLNNTDPRAARVEAENRVLRRRVAEMEAELGRLRAEKDALVAVLDEPVPDRVPHTLDDGHMQPA